MAQADLYDHSKPAFGSGIARLAAVARALFGTKAKATAPAQRRAADPREAGYLADIGMETGF